MLFSSRRVASRTANQIISWFEASARDLPWRRTCDPYAIWISEVMLQQTQVKTVIPYWRRWMEKFPDAPSLGRAREEAVLKAWEGLGYYTRARNLRRAASIILERHRGRFPERFEDVLALPGIGRYTAGAICSIAFGQPTAALDGNVARVLTRFFAVDAPIQKHATRQLLWGAAEALVNNAARERKCSELNQGLMELGATICTPRKPDCPLCPLRRSCAACRQRRVSEFPRIPVKPKARTRLFHAFIVRRAGQVLVRRRARQGVNGGFWEFPNLEIADSNPSEPFDTRASSPVAVIKHTITNNRITLRAFAISANGNAARLAKDLHAAWRDISDLDDLPFSSAHARLRALVQAGAECRIGRGPA